MGNELYYKIVKSIFLFVDDNYFIVFFVFALIQYIVSKIKNKESQNKNQGTLDLLQALVSSTINTVTAISGLKLCVYSFSTDGKTDFPLSDMRIYLMGVSIILLFYVIYSLLNPIEFNKKT